MTKQIFYSSAAFLCILFLWACSGKKQNSGSLDPQAFKDSIAQAQVVLVDVRTPEEYSEGHIANAQLINYQDSSFLVTVLAKIPKASHVYLYCHSGRRSAAARDKMTALGYDHVTHLTGGIKAWQEAGFTVQK
jgi:phage shock protein E